MKYSFQSTDRVRRLVVVLAAALFCFPSPARSQASIGSVISNPVYVNIYWDAAWDTHHPAMTMNHIDNFLSAVVNSSYFIGLAEYGVGAPILNFASFKASPSCFGGGTAPATIGIVDIRNFVNCESGLSGMPNGSNVIYNVFVPAATTQKDFGLLTSCVNYASYHFVGESILPLRGAFFTAIFASPACNKTFAVLTTNLTHEMIEAATNPVVSLPVVLSAGDAEIGDLCSAATTPFLAAIGGGATQDYFSNTSGRCVPGYFLPATPVPTSVTVTGSGQSTSISIAGAGFGSLPPISTYSNNTAGTTVALPATTSLPYLSLTDVNQKWSLGDLLTNASSLDYGLWSAFKVAINGLPSPSFAPSPGDALSIVLCNPESGACSATITGGVPGQPFITQVDPPIGPAGGGTSVTITGKGFGSAPTVQLANCCQAAPVQIVGQPSDTQIKLLTQPFVPSFLGIQISDGSVSNNVNLGWGTFQYCGPAVTSVSPSNGPVTGGTLVTLSGNCFTDATSVRFGPAAPVSAGAHMTVVDDRHITVTAPPYSDALFGCGLVNVVVNSPAENNSFVSSPIDAGDEFQYTGTRCLQVPHMTPHSLFLTLCEFEPKICEPIAVANILTLQPSAPFEDLSGYEWAASDIAAIARQGVLTALAPRRFAPGTTVTREEFALALARVLKFPATKTALRFSDVGPNQAGAQAIARVQPYMTAYGNSAGTLSFYPTVPVEREEAAATIATLLEKSGKLGILRSKEESEPALRKVADERFIPSRFRAYVASAVHHKLMPLDLDGNFRPTAYLTRGDFAALLITLEKHF